MLPGRGKDKGGDAHAAATYQVGLAAFEAGRFREAIEHLSRIADQRNLAATLARFYLGQAYLRLGIAELRNQDYEAASRHLAEARRINPDSVGLATYLAACHRARGRLDAAVGELEREQAAGAGDESLPIRLAHAFAADGQFERAIETLQKAAASAPRRADLRHQMGVLHASREDYAAALREFVSASALAPRDAAIHQQMGLAYAALGRIDDAATCLATAQRLAPHDAHAAWLLALAMRAAQEAGRSIRAEPIEARSAAGDAATRASMAEAIIAEPEFIEAFLSLPKSSLDREIFAELILIVQWALERQPDYADLHYHCGRVFERLGRNDDAIREARLAVELNPRYIQALIQLGRLYAQTDRRLAAIARLEEAIARGADYPDVHYLLGRLYRDAGNPAEARERFRRALELNQNYRPAREALETALEA